MWIRWICLSFLSICTTKAEEDVFNGVIFKGKTVLKRSLQKEKGGDISKKFSMEIENLRNISENNADIKNSFQNDEFDNTSVKLDNVFGEKLNANLDAHNLTVTQSSNDVNVLEHTANFTFLSLTPALFNKYMLPPIWERFCYIGGNEIYVSEFTAETHLTTIRCHVTQAYSGIWKMSDLRLFLQQYRNSSINFSIELLCQTGSNISVSWPMKVDNLFKLEIETCLVLDFLADYNNTYVEILPDSLRVLELKDISVLISFSRFYNMTKNIKYISKDFDCGQDDTIEKIIMRNISYDFLENIEVVAKQLNELASDFIKDTKRRNHTCDYRHLMALEESLSDSMSLYHLKLVTEKSFYDQLRTYNLSYNYIKVLKDSQLQWSSDFPKLEIYDLSHNEISKLYRFEIPVQSQKNKSTTINLQYNNISSFTVQDLDRFKEMPTMFVDLRNNPIDCNCSEDLKALVQYIKNGMHLQISNLSNYGYISELQCSSPRRLFNVTLGSLTSEMICLTTIENEYFLVPVLCMSIAIVVLCCILFMVLRYRQEITVILFTRLNIIVPCQTREYCDAKKKYDAFISYSSNEEEWVEHLFENLERKINDRSKKPFKLCLHHRDFVPGRTILENITNSIESSRHTIILLSNHFIKSEFCLHEFQEAFRQSIIEQKRHLIIVMMEDVQEQHLPRELRRCIKTFTYIRKDDSLFYERLIYALSVKAKQRTVKEKKSQREYKQYQKDNCKINTIAVKNSSNNVSLSDTPVTEIQIKENVLSLNTDANSNEHRSENGKERLKNANQSCTKVGTDKGYGRSASVLSHDTGYSSDLSSYNLGLSPAICVDKDYFTLKMPPEICEDLGVFTEPSQHILNGTGQPTDELKPMT